MDFREKWMKAVEEKNSVLCAGLDPAEYAMGRGPKGLAEGTGKRDWAMDYVKSVAPYCAALKPNIQYWKSAGLLCPGGPYAYGDMENLEDITKLAHELGMVVIEDSKLADIGSTNEAGFFYASQKKADAVTFSPFAGNMKEAAKQGKKWNVGVISMCLMSNPEFEREKNKLVPLSEEGAKEYSHGGLNKTDASCQAVRATCARCQGDRYGRDCDRSTE